KDKGSGWTYTRVGKKRYLSETNIEQGPVPMDLNKVKAKNKNQTAPTKW
ncbi:9924_t:CDS:1, partial [Racocetra persica]